jgi:predicted transcriptional regulator
MHHTNMLIFDKSVNKKHHRSRPDIIAQILTAAKEPKGKTKLMYIAMISSHQTCDYLTELLAKGLLSYDEVIRTFQTTTQGDEYLRLYDNMKRLDTIRRNK